MPVSRKALVLAAALICIAVLLWYAAGTAGSPPAAGNATRAGAAGIPVKTAYFEKYVGNDTPSVIADLYSGDPADPLSLTVITPDRVLGPFTDASDGRIDGRISLRITRPPGMAAGNWTFVVQSEKTIRIGSLPNVTVLRTGLRPQGS